MTLVDAAQALAIAARSPLFANVPASIVDRTLAAAELIELAPSDRIILEDSPPSGTSDSGLYLLLQGQLLATREAGGRTERLSTMSIGEFFGELARTDDKSRSATVAAVTPALVARLPGPVTDMLIAEAPVVMRTIAASIARRLRAADEARLQARLDEDRLSVVGRAAAMLVHDLRNPLGVIKNACTLAEQGIGSPSHWAVRSRAAAEFMLAIVEDLLEFARGNRVYAREPFNFRDVVRDLEEFALGSAENAGIVVVRLGTSADALLLGDRRALTRGILNIVKNAIDAMRNGGTLSFSVEVDEATLHIEISDTGPGIPPNVLGTLFEPFSTYGKEGGTGLGMAMAKAAVEAHCGTVTVTSAAGAGTTFTVILPLLR